MTYETPRALEMAVKEAAKASPLDTGRAVSGFFFHRLLCRIFMDGNDSFVLKGGQSMLARTIDARATRDIDLLSRQDTLEDALSSLVELAQKDLNDFVTFEYVDIRPIKVEDDYRSGCSVRFTPILGNKRMQDISIDLVVDEIPLEYAERVSPVDRIEVSGIQTCDYLVYPVENALADKLCALLERHDGRASSRIKDLVDIAVYATTCDVDGNRLQKQIQKEAAVRGIALPNSFAIPSTWTDMHEKQFAKLCSQTGLPESLRTIDASESLARELFGPTLQSSSAGLFWDHSAGQWTEIAPTD